MATSTTDSQEGSTMCRRVATALLCAAAWAGSAGAGPLVDSGNLVGYWKLNEPTGTTARDSSGYGSSGTFADAARTTGLFAGAELCGGDNDFIYVPAAAPLQDVQEGDYTLAAWVKPDQLPPTGGNNYSTYGILMKSGYHTGLSYKSTGAFCMSHWLAPSTGNSISSTATYAPDEWHHVVGTVSRTDGTVMIYVDGVLQGARTYTPGAAAREYGTTPWRLGIANPSASSWRWPMDGVIDEVAVWDTALPAAQVGQLHQLYTGDGLIHVADYADDFQGPTPTTGWQYLWNEGGPIGDAANYVPLLWDGSRYDADGVPGLPSAQPAGYVFLGATSGHPGYGSAQSPNTIDRFAIGAYTVATAGEYAITDGTLSMTSAARTPGTHVVELRVYVDDELHYAETDVDATTFHLWLGSLAAGQTIYVAVGPQGSPTYDSFRVDYTILRTPEPATLLLLSASLAALAARRRKHR